MIVVDSSPLIALERIGETAILPRTLGALSAPDAAAREIGRCPEWLGVRKVTDRAFVDSLRARLDAGESEAIALAVAVRAQAVLMDERRGRAVAAEWGIPVIGTVGVLPRAKRQGHIEAIRPRLDALARCDFRLAPALRVEALRLASET